MAKPGKVGLEGRRLEARPDSEAVLVNEAVQGRRSWCRRVWEVALLYALLTCLKGDSALRSEVAEVDAFFRTWKAKHSEQAEGAGMCCFR